MIKKIAFLKKSPIKGRAMTIVLPLESARGPAYNEKRILGMFSIRPSYTFSSETSLYKTAVLHNSAHARIRITREE